MRSRRQLIKGVGEAVVLCAVASCQKKGPRGDDERHDERHDEPADAKPAGATRPTEGAAKKARDPAPPPPTRPAGWDPIAYNRDRGNAGAIPESYLDAINGPDGEKKHLGKHLPYQPELNQEVVVPEGHVALMWGDLKKAHARHPNAEKGPENNHEGHWFNWIRIRKAVDREDVEETQTNFSSWPETAPGDNGKYAGLDGQEITSDQGKNTIYLAVLPKDVGPGDTVRIWAHCLTHGEYVDFLTLT